VTVKEIDHPAYPGYLLYDLEVAGADHQGIIHGISEFLAGKGVNIAESKTSTYNSPVSGTPLFSMTALLQVPPNLSAEDLRQSLTDLGDAQSVDITFTTSSL
jgi:glycine cleavage system transcriptional repressor